MAPGPAGPAGDGGARGPDGPRALEGDVYIVTEYENGGGGDATTACADDPTESQKYTAIAAGVETGKTGANDVAVTASFPGRMSWGTGEPRPNRLDGWIVLGNGKYASKPRVWALCVPTTNIPVQTVVIDS